MSRPILEILYQGMVGTEEAGLLPARFWTYTKRPHISGISRLGFANLEVEIATGGVHNSGHNDHSSADTFRLSRPLHPPHQPKSLGKLSLRRQRRVSGFMKVTSKASTYLNYLQNSRTQSHNHWIELAHSFIFKAGPPYLAQASLELTSSCDHSASASY